MKALILVLLSGCLYVSRTEGEGTGELGIEYRCTFRLNSVDRDERVCAANDAAERAKRNCKECGGAGWFVDGRRGDAACGTCTTRSKAVTP